jgi:SnoaL-like domain
MRHTRSGRGAWTGWLACALLACALFAAAGCHRTPAEQVIRNTIDAMHQAGEKHDIDGVIAPMADDFAGRDDDNELNADRKDFKRYLTLLQMQEGGSLHATLGPVTVALQGADHATADFTMLVTGGNGLLPSDGQMQQVHTGWRLDGGKWELILAEWKADRVVK